VEKYRIIANDVWYRHIWGSDGGEGSRVYDLHEWDAQCFERSYCIHLQDFSDLKIIVAMSSGMLVALGWITRYCIPQLTCTAGSKIFAFHLIMKFVRFLSQTNIHLYCFPNDH